MKNIVAIICILASFYSYSQIDSVQQRLAIQEYNMETRKDFGIFLILSGLGVTTLNNVIGGGKPKINGIASLTTLVGVSFIIDFDNRKNGRKRKSRKTRH
jgi:hypothetical protein